MGSNPTFAAPGSAGPGFAGKFFYVLRGHRLRLLGMVGLFATLSAMDVVGVGLIGPFIAAVIQPSRLARLPRFTGWLTALGHPFHLAAIPMLGILLLVMFAIKGVFGYAITRKVFAFAFAVRADLIERLMSAYLVMPYQFYLDRNSATLVHSVVNETKVMTDDLLIPVLRSVSDSLVLGFIAVFLFVVNPIVMTAFAAMFGITFAIYGRVVRPRTRSAGGEVAVANEQIIRGVNEAIGGIKDIRILGLAAPFLRFIMKAADANTVAQLRFYSYLALPRYLMETAVMLFILVLALVVVVRGEGATDMVALLAMFAAASLRGLPAMVQVSSSLASMSYSSHALTTLYDDLRAVQSVAAAAANMGESGGFGAAVPAESFREVRLENVTFSYPHASAPAVAGVDLVINRGSSVAFIGESGSGKTTLVDLLLGLHRMDSGRILVDGADLDDVGWERWTRRIAYIPQSVFIIDDTLRRNVALGAADAEIDSERMAEAIRMAQLTGLVARLPAGLDSVLGERGGRLSGGERQRIALARAFYHQREVLVFDEATSALDTETEREVIKVVESLRGLKTVIVVAHRLSTVSGCDVVHRLSAGRVVRSGKLEEVASV